MDNKSLQITNHDFLIYRDSNNDIKVSVMLINNDIWLTQNLIAELFGVGRSTITVWDFMNLQLGDVIKLNKGIEEEMDVYVGNIVKFKSLPGSINDNYAVKITEIIREEE